MRNVLCTTLLNNFVSKCAKANQGFLRNLDGQKARKTKKVFVFKIKSRMVKHKEFDSINQFDIFIVEYFIYNLWCS